MEHYKRIETPAKQTAPRVSENVLRNEARSNNRKALFQLGSRYVDARLWFTRESLYQLA